MSDRFDELMYQAGITAQGCWDEMDGYDRDAILNFAELIVRECAHVAVFKDSGTVATAEVAGHMAAGRSIAARSIKQHFGVEE